ncbi:hypothetical protein ACFWDI_35740 [Streptomyces sp. NPDC060064]|uniref:hypothetical protein n=1 Tax=Streptomyces sp. NPDC060064 TaxID=3347049 RepID=UPI0036AAD240
MATTISADEARSAFQTLVAKHQLNVQEIDDSTLSAVPPGYHMGHVLRIEGSDDVLVLPLGQEPVDRLVATYHLLRCLGLEGRGA